MLYSELSQAAVRWVGNNPFVVFFGVWLVLGIVLYIHDEIFKAD